MITLWIIAGMLVAGIVFHRSFAEIKKEGQGFAMFAMVVILIAWPVFVGLLIAEYFDQ